MFEFQRLCTFLPPPCCMEEGREAWVMGRVEKQIIDTLFAKWFLKIFGPLVDLLGIPPMQFKIDLNILLH